MQDSQSATYMVANLAVVTRRRKHIGQSVSGCSTVMTKPERTRRKKSRFLQKIMVRPRRLELPRVLPHSDLNAARLPIPPRPHV